MTEAALLRLTLRLQQALQQYNSEHPEAPLFVVEEALLSLKDLGEYLLQICESKEGESDND